MGDTPAIPFGLASYQAVSKAISCQQLLNCYTQIQRQNMDAKGVAPLLGRPGLTQFATAGSGPWRALIEMNDLLYGISGSNFYYIASTGVATLLGGGIGAGAQVLGISENGSQIIFVDGVRGFVYNADTAVYAQIASVGFLPAKTVSFLQSYFLLDAFGTNKFFSSASEDGTTYDATFTASAETSSDDVESTVAHQGQLLVTGHKGIEFWQFNPNTANFPWNRYPGAATQPGLAGPFAATSYNNRFFYVGRDAKFYQLNGSEPVSKTDPAVAAQWQGYGDISDVVVFGMTFGDHEWIVITFPAAMHTWLYDVTTGFFHEWESHDSDMVPYGRWRGNCFAKCYGKFLIGDAFTNQIGELSSTAYDEYGNPMRMRAVSPTLHNDGGTIFMSSLEFLMEVGVGLATGQGSNPKMILDWSDDDGRTWCTNPEILYLGQLGEYNKTVRATELGSFTNRIFRITIIDPVKRVIVSAIPKVAGGLKYG